MKITKSVTLIAVLFLAMFAAAFAQSAPALSVSSVKVNDIEVTPNQASRIAFDRNSNLEVKVNVQTLGVTPINDVTVNAVIDGGKDDVSARSDSFTAQPNATYQKILTLSLPARLVDQSYQLSIEVRSPNSGVLVYQYPLLVEAPKNSIAIREVTFSPNTKVLAGRAMTAVARLRNYGQSDENDVKVVFSIPELGVQETTYVNQIEKDHTVSTEEVLLRIPVDAKSGSYDVETTAYFNDGDDKTTSTSTINVAGDEVAAQAMASGVSGLTGKTTISVGVQTQTVARGENGVIYPITLTNGANTAKTYTLDVSGTADWSTTRVSPSNVVILNAGETKQVYVYVAANENSAVGEHVFSVDVKDGNNVVQQIPLKAEVLESAGNSWNGVKTALQVLVILLVIVLVVIGIALLYQRKFKGSESKTEETIAQTYY